MKKFTFSVVLCEGYPCTGTVSVVADTVELAHDKALSYVCDRLNQALPELDINVSVSLVTEENHLRKVLIAEDVQDSMIIVTDAPTNEVELWIRKYCESIANSPATKDVLDVNTGVDGYYWRLVYDSENTVVESPDVIGWDESFNLNNYYPKA